MLLGRSNPRSPFATWHESLPPVAFHTDLSLISNIKRFFQARFCPDTGGYKRRERLCSNQQEGTADVIRLQNPRRTTCPCLSCTMACQSPPVARGEAFSLTRAMASVPRTLSQKPLIESRCSLRLLNPALALLNSTSRH